MYLEHWGLARWPFEHGADDEFVFLHEEMKTAQDDLLDAILRRRGGMLLTGPIGCGKTTLAQRVLLSLPPEDVEVALIAFPELSADELLAAILVEFGLDADGDRVMRVQRIADHLRRLHEEGKQALVCIDEAQAIPDRHAFETLRLLLGLQLAGRFLLSLFLIGQPEIEEKLEQIPALAQRIGLVVRLHPLSPTDTIRYILFRLRKAGCKRPILTRQAAELVFRLTGGIPRRINNLMDRCLVAGMREGARLIDAALVRRTAARYAF